MKIIIQNLLRTSVICLAILFTILVFPANTKAQYGQGSYSGAEPSAQCPYGQSCTTPIQPTDPIPETPTPQPTTPTTPDLNIEDPMPAPQIINDDRPNGGSTPSATPPKASEKVQVKGIQGVILKQTVDIVEKIPESQRAVAPYYSWFLLLILSFILLVVALVDRYKSVKLVNSIKSLQAVLQEQRNFLRLALHHLNTPLATTKSTLELLQSIKPPETKAVAQLKPATLELEVAINQTTSEISKEPETGDSLARSTSGVTFFRVIGQWYFFIPVITSVLFALLLNSAVSYTTDTSRPANYALLQVAVAIMICLIFANAIRVLRISRHQKRIINQVITLIERLKLQRSQVVSNLKDSLKNIIGNFKIAIELIKDKKISKILSNSILSLESLSTKIDMATNTTIDPPATCNIQELIKQVVDKNIEIAKKKSLSVHDNYSFTNMLKININALDLILGSIIENSFEYSKEGGEVNIYSEATKDKLLIKITDNGEGIDKKDLDKLFKPFSKTSDVLTYDHNGMGISLYASKAVADKINGTINIESKKNKGTTVSISVPIYN